MTVEKQREDFDFASMTPSEAIASSARVAELHNNLAQSDKSLIMTVLSEPFDNTYDSLASRELNGDRRTAKGFADIELGPLVYDDRFMLYGIAVYGRKTF